MAGFKNKINKLSSNIESLVYSQVYPKHYTEKYLWAATKGNRFILKTLFAQ